MARCFMVKGRGKGRGHWVMGRSHFNAANPEQRWGGGGRIPLNLGKKSLKGGKRWVLGEVQDQYC